MPALYRLQWIDAQIRAGRYPNAKSLSERFEISRRQSLRDFEYLRDSLGAPLTYSALHRGYTYDCDAFTLPGAFVTEAQATALGHLGAYYEGVAKQDERAGDLYAGVADVLLRLSRMAPARPSPRTAAPPRGWRGLAPYRALLGRTGGWTRPADLLAPYWRGVTPEGSGACEFHDADAFLTALLGSGAACRIEWPRWLRERLQQRLEEILGLNAGVTRSVTATLLSSGQEPGAGPGQYARGIQKMSENRKETNARFTSTWMSYVGALHGVLSGAGMTEFNYAQLMGLTGLAYHFNLHEALCVSSVTVYDWMGLHHQATERMGILSEHFVAHPGSPVYDAAARRGVARIKEAIDQGIGAVVWGINTGEFGVAYGYDDADGVLLCDGIGGVDATKPVLYENLGRTFEGAPLLYYQIPLEKVEVDRDQMFRASLEAYVRMMESPIQYEPAYRRGLAAYDQWARAVLRDDCSQSGLRYNTVVYADAKACGASYMRYLAETWKGVDNLPAIADAFERVSEQFAAILKVIGQSLCQPQTLWDPVAPAAIRACEPLIREAGSREEEALALVKRALNG